MSLNLLRAGHEVIGFTRTAARADPLRAAGGSIVGSIAEAVAGAEAVITMLPDSPDVASVYGEEEGVLASAPDGALLIDASTIEPRVARDLARRAVERGLALLDAPVSGGEKGAQDGQLSIMVGGPADAFAAAEPILSALGSTIVHVGPSGAGQTVKAANQLLVAGIIELVSEAFVFLDAHDVDLEPAIRVLNGGLAGNTVLTRKGAAMLRGDFSPGFRVALHDKDLGIYREAARAHDVFSPLGSVVAELMRAVRVDGGADLDHGALLAQVDRLSGRGRWGGR
jgi:2-hydroxy-3-oxopropionate reductase